MARGITESDVHTAADQVVANGERPTVERIRAHLGTGSPNTVTRWLETWWQRLGERLQSHHARLAVPGAPDAVAALAGEWWALALQSAQVQASQELVTDRAVLLTDQQALAQARERWAAEAAMLQAQIQASQDAERLASAQSTQLQYRVDQLQDHLRALTDERDAAQARAAQAETARQLAEDHLRTQEAAARTERAATAQHVHAVEERAGVEIDRARQETKGLQKRIATLSREHREALVAAQRSVEDALLQTSEARKELEIQRARADALEAQLGKALDLSSAVEAALRSGAVKARKAPSATALTKSAKKRKA